MRKKHSQSFLEGAAVLTLSTIVVKVIGALFKIPLANILGGVGMSYFVSAYDLFTPIYSVTVTGLGVASSRLISETAASSGPGGVSRVLRASRRLFLALGVLGMAAVVFFARPFSAAISNPGAVWAVYAIAPAVLFSCVSAIYRGYFQGMSNMIPTAKSQVLESLIRLAAGTSLSYGVTLLLRRSYLERGEVLGRAFASLDEAGIYIFQFSAAAAIWGVTLSTAAGAAYIRWSFGKNVRPVQTFPDGGKGRPSVGTRLLRIAVPISLSTLVVNLTSMIDLMSVMNCLKAAVAENGELIRSMYPGLIPGAVTDDMLPEYLYGSYSGLAFSLFNLAPAITAALGVSALPAVTRAWTSGDEEQMEYTVNAVIRMALLVALPAGLGLFALSGPILRFLYPARLMEAAIITPVLRVMGISTILVAATTPVNSVLQATGHERMTLATMAAGAAMKLATNFALVSRPEMNIQGVPYGSLVCYGFIVVFSIIYLRARTGVRLHLFQGVCKPLFCAVLCAGAAYSGYFTIFSAMGGAFRLFLSIGCGGGVYLLTLLLTGAILKSDLEMLPKNEKVAKALEKLGLIR